MARDALTGDFTSYGDYMGAPQGFEGTPFGSPGTEGGANKGVWKLVRQPDGTWRNTYLPGGFSALAPTPAPAPAVAPLPSWQIHTLNTAFAQGWEPTFDDNLDWKALTDYGIPAEWFTGGGTFHESWQDKVRREWTAWQAANKPAVDPTQEAATNVFQDFFTNPDKWINTTTTYEGLSPDDQALVRKEAGPTGSIMGPYSKMLSGVSSPAAFISSYYPAQKGINETLIRNLAERGILSSTEAENILGEAANKLPYAYLQNIAAIAPLFAQAGGTWTDMMDLLSGTTTTTKQPTDYMQQAWNMFYTGGQTE